MFDMMRLIGITEEDANRFGQKIGKTFTNLKEFFDLASQVLDVNIHRCKKVISSLEEKGEKVEEHISDREQ